MNSYVKIFVFVFVTAVLAACSSGPSPKMKEAMKINADVVRVKDSLKTDVETKLSAVRQRIETADTTIDSLTLSTWNTALTSLGDLQAQLITWESNIQVMPSEQAMAEGAANPYGSMTDEQILEEQKNYWVQINDLKTKIDAAPSATVVVNNEPTPAN